MSASGLEYATVPPFAGTGRRWRDIVKCVRSKFEPYDIQVVDKRPVGDDYVMAVLGGRPSLLGEGIPVQQF